jgi:hypothetical protein
LALRNRFQKYEKRPSVPFVTGYRFVNHRQEGTAWRVMAGRACELEQSQAEPGTEKKKASEEEIAVSD